MANFGYLSIYNFYGYFGCIKLNQWTICSIFLLTQNRLLINRPSHKTGKRTSNASKTREITKNLRQQYVLDIKNVSFTHHTKFCVNGVFCNIK